MKPFYAYCAGILTMSAITAIGVNKETARVTKQLTNFATDFKVKSKIHANMLDTLNLTNRQETSAKIALTRIQTYLDEALGSKRFKLKGMTMAGYKRLIEEEIIKYNAMMAFAGSSLQLTSLRSF